MNKGYVVIGSTAMRHYFPDFRRENKDIDVAISDLSIKADISNKFDNRGKKVEYLLNPILLDYISHDNEFLTPDELLTLKMSHLVRDVFWEKHMFDAQFLIKKGAKCIDSLFYDLIEYWKESLGIMRRSDLTMNSSDFFNNAVKSGLDHDYIHTILKNPPTYEKVLKDGAEVEPSEEKFDKLTFEEKCELVQEEVMVMAYERFNKRPFKNAYSIMLKKFIQAHAPFWEMKFIVENFMTMEKPPYNYYKKIEENLNIEKCN